MFSSALQQLHRGFCTFLASRADRNAGAQRQRVDCLTQSILEGGVDDTGLLDGEVIDVEHGDTQNEYDGWRDDLESNRVHFAHDAHQRSSNGIPPKRDQFVN